MKHVLLLLVSWGVFLTSTVGAQDAVPEAPRPSQRQDDRWVAVAPNQVAFPSPESAEVLRDKSVQLSLPSPNWSEPELHFTFASRQTIVAVRLEILADTRFADRRLGRRPNTKLKLFELKPLLRPRGGKPKYLEFAHCQAVPAGDQDQLPSLIDYATDTGWRVPNLPAGADAIELVFTFEPPVTVAAQDRLVLFPDSGGSDELDTLARFRLSFATHGSGDSAR